MSPELLCIFQTGSASICILGCEIYADLVYIRVFTYPLITAYVIYVVTMHLAKAVHPLLDLPARMETIT